MKKSGFTLIELLVYMGILGFIIVVAGRVFSDSTAMRVRSQNMLKSSEALGKVSALLKEDISQMGTKAWGEHSTNSTDGYMVTVEDSVYWKVSATVGSGDSSSYELHHRQGADDIYFDSLVLKKAEYDTLGKFLGVRRISWWANKDSEKLYRSCRTIYTKTGGCASEDKDCENVCPFNEENSVLIAENVKRFHLIPSKPGTQNASDTLFPTKASDGSKEGYKFIKRESGDHVSSSIAVGEGNLSYDGTTITVSSGVKNSEDGKDFNQVQLAKFSSGNCFDMNLIKGETYVVKFELPYLEKGDTKNDTNSTQFQPGVDHIAVGFRDKEWKEIDVVSSDVLFYPPQTQDANGLVSHAEFSVREDVQNACLTLTFAFYSIKASQGKFRFKNFEILRKADETFHFEDDGYGVGSDNENKKNVKAFELEMEIEYKGEKVSTYSNPHDQDKKRGMIITTPNNGVIAKGSE